MCIVSLWFWRRLLSENSLPHSLTTSLISSLLEKTSQPDIAVLDINLPDRNGFELLQDIQRSQPNLPVLFLTMHPEEILALRAMQAGAKGYLCKNCSSEELVKALRKIAAGGVYVSTPTHLGKNGHGKQFGTRPLRHQQPTRLTRVGFRTSIITSAELKRIKA